MIHNSYVARRLDLEMEGMGDTGPCNCAKMRNFVRVLVETTHIVNNSSISAADSLMLPNDLACGIAATVAVGG